MGSGFLSRWWLFVFAFLGLESNLLSIDPPPPGADCIYEPYREKTFTYLSSRLHTEKMDSNNPVFDVDFRISSNSVSNTWSTLVSYNCRNEFEAKKSFEARYHKITSGACQPYVYTIPALSQNCAGYFWEALFNF